MHELKKNYKIDNHQQIIGYGRFGKVFLSQNIHNPDLYVAIKVLDKSKTEYNINELIETI